MNINFWLKSVEAKAKVTTVPYATAILAKHYTQLQIKDNMPAFNNFFTR